MVSDELTSWDFHFIEVAELVSKKSKDRSTKVGAVIVGTEDQILSTGFNGFPRGINDHVDSRHERPSKYLWTEHAERNAIYNAASHGTALKGSRLYLNYTPEAICSNCMRAIIQSGIKEVIGPNKSFPNTSNNWNEDFEVSKEMRTESLVKMKVIENEQCSCSS